MNNAAKIVLLESPTGQEAVARLCRYLKAKDKKFTLGYICRKAGISSTGYLSDIIKGRRSVNPKYHSSLPKALGLKGMEAEHLTLLLEFEHSKEEADRQEIADRIERSHKALSFSLINQTLAPSHENLHFYFTVFSAFFLFEGKPSKGDLQNYFAKEYQFDLEKALYDLEAKGLIRKQGDRYFFVSDKVFFAPEDQAAQVGFLKAAMEYSRKHCSDWFAAADQAVFCSSIITVNRKRYPQVLQKIKAELIKMQTDLDADDPDELISFNAQIFPYRPPERRR